MPCEKQVSRLCCWLVALKHKLTKRDVLRRLRVQRVNPSTPGGDGEMVVLVLDVRSGLGW